MSGINDALRGNGCVLKGWVCLSQPRFVLCVCVCVCVSLFPDSVLSSLQNNSRCCLCSLCFEAHADRFKRHEECEVLVFHSIAARRSKTSKLQRVLPSLHLPQSLYQLHTETSVCSVRWQPGLKHHSWMITQYDLFPSLFFLPSLLSLCLSVCLHWEKETYVPVRGETH